MSNDAQNVTVKVELLKMFSVKENSNSTKYRNCHVKFTDPVSKEESTVWARIWETSVENGAKVGDLLSARLESWVGTDGETRETLTVIGGSDAVQASASLFKNALSAVATSAPDLNKP
jgi:hypothetical protein